MDAERFLSTTVSVLAAAPDLRTAIEDLGQLAASRLAEWCAFYAFENEQTVRRLAVMRRGEPRNSSPQPAVLYPLDLHGGSGPGYVLRTGELQLVANITDQVAESLGFKPEELITADGRRLSACICAPAAARGRTIGAVAFITSDSSRRFDDASVALARTLASAAAVAIDQARVHREAQEARRLKDEFVDMVSHELRTPLTPILGCVHLLRTAKLSDTNFTRALEMIERNAQAQVQIVDDLFDVSRIVAGRLNLALRPVQLVPLLEASIDLAGPAAQSKGVEIVAKLGDIPDSIEGDPGRMQQVVRNLLSNAVKFTPSGGRIEISAQRGNDHVVVQVTDTGVGIPADSLPFIFDRLRRDNGNSRVRSGLGLGLAIVRHLVELHQGSIEAASPGPGQGAIFTLKFPLSSQKAAAAAP